MPAATRERLPAFCQGAFLQTSGRFSDQGIRLSRYDVLASYIPSLDKGRHGFDGQKWAHTASSPLTIRQVFSAGLSLSGRISAPAKLPAPDRNGFSSDFCFLRRRWAGAHQGEKSKKRRKDALSGVFALVNRWYERSRAGAVYCREKGAFNEYSAF